MAPDLHVSELSWRLAALALALAAAETLHGIARMTLLVPRIGLRKAQAVGIVTGSLLAFAVCAALVPGLGLRSPRALALLGLWLAAFMAAFDVLIGRVAARRPWKLIARDFDPRTGNYLVFGLAFLAFCPWIVMALRG
ncbi:MAG: hypothetical protein U0P81_02785 [Holophagaceae bacterium]